MGGTGVAHEVIAFDMALDHSCPDIWRILTAPEWYPRFFRGLGSCEQVSGPNRLFEVRFSTPRGTAAVQPMTQTILRAGREMRLEATQASRCFVSVRLTPEADGTRIALRIFALGLIHPDLAKAGDGAVRHWVSDGLLRISDYLDGKQSSLLTNMGDGRSLHLSVMKTMLVSGVVRASRPDRGIRQLNSLAKWGFTLAGGLGAAAARSPRNTASVDRYGTLTYAEMAERTSHLASGLAAAGYTADSRFAVLARNHSAMVECHGGDQQVGCEPGVAQHRPRGTGDRGDHRTQRRRRHLRRRRLRAAGLIPPAGDCTDIDAPEFHSGPTPFH